MSRTMTCATFGARRPSSGAMVDEEIPRRLCVQGAASSRKSALQPPQARLERRRERGPARSGPPSTSRTAELLRAVAALVEAQVTETRHCSSAAPACCEPCCVPQRASRFPAAQSSDVRPCALLAFSRHRPWLLGIGAAALAAAFFVPDANSFARYVRTRQAGPKGLLTGGLAWLQHRSGVRSTFRQYAVCAVATLGSRAFLGAFGTWVELPELPRKLPRRLQDVLPADAEGAPTHPPPHRDKPPAPTPSRGSG